MASTAFPAPPDNKVTRFGLRVRVGLEPLLGEMDVVRVTVPAKPPMLVNVIMLLVAEPRVTFMEDGDAEIDTVIVEAPAPVRRDKELGFNAIVTFVMPGESE